MVATWKSEKGADRTCKCGAVYEVKYTRFPVRDADYFDCSACGDRLDTWNDTYSPSYTLKSKPDAGTDAI